MCKIQNTFEKKTIGFKIHFIFQYFWNLSVTRKIQKKYHKIEIFLTLP